MELVSIILLMTIVGVYLVWFWLLVGKLKGPKSWPLVGSIPQMLLTIRRIHEWTTDQLLASPTLGTYQTCEHILHTKFHNYPKGPTWQNTFGDVLGNQGVSCAKGEEWISLRKIVVPELTKSKLGPSLHRWVNPSIKNDLLPILDKASKHNISIDLQKLMICFGTDNIFELL
ncbi:hypothetical protein H5410_064762 [Solanum commersonii]|uniref:Cytochrome P450 n=1 Tax=Solanum commersonii TaxID=4109 RepID=A0A9J5VYS7_SOLCO|nr:hypothetical protein H5410_064762 [Solanum commersonii]